MSQGKDRTAPGTTAFTRREFLISGTAAVGALASLKPASAEQAGNGNSLIHIYLPGGPSHLDTFDLKPGAPSELRGEFRPIRTSVPGVELCEHFPKLARLADRFTILRGITGLRDEHSPRPADSGWPADSLSELGGRPGISAVLSAIEGGSTSKPTSVDLTGWTSAGFLGDRAAIFEPARLEWERNRFRRRLRKTRPKQCPIDLVLREDKRNSAKPLRRDCPALDLSRESDKTLRRYGIDARQENARFLEARRLVEQGTRSVSLAWGFWDTHGNNFGQLKTQLPALDRGLSALIEDLSSRGRLENTLILMTGEFGRTPEINNGAGRDHWPEVSFAFLAGGGLPHGRVVGKTDRHGRFPKDPIPLPAVFAAVYAGLGLSAERIRLCDPSGRRHPLVARTSLPTALC